MYKPIELKLKNSCINFEIIKKIPLGISSYVKKIADFLVDGLYWSEEEYGVQFHDVTSAHSDKWVSHFRSSSVNDVLKYVENCWEDVCLRDANKLIPAYKLKVDNIDGTISIKYLNTLNYFCATKIIDGDNSEILNTPSLEIAKTSNGNDDLEVLDVELLSTANIIRNDDSEVGTSLVENVFQDNLPFDDVLISTPKICCNVQGELDQFEGSIIVSENVLSSGDKHEETGGKNECIDFHKEREYYAYVEYIVNEEDEDDCIVYEKDNVCNVDKEDGGIVMQIYPEKFENIPGKEGCSVSHALLEIFGADELIDEYHKGKIKFDKYPGEIYRILDFRVGGGGGFNFLLHIFL